jgi:membrane associated rhomboid family serine protease
MSQFSEVPVRVARGRRAADEWALVLVAEGLAPRVWRAPEGFAVGVVDHDLDRAAAALEAYDQENPSGRAHDPDRTPPGDGAFLAGLGASAALLVFFTITGARDPGVRWFARGAADAGRIGDGELWRTVTALTLHADLTHVATNAAIGAWFFTAVCRALGPGLGGALLLLAGAGGNFANAVLHGSSHSSVGASTAVFGAVGLLGGLAVTRRQRRGLRGPRAWIPVAASIGLLAMLGTAGERVDLWAHASGLGVGGALGLAAGRLWRRPPEAAAQWSLGVATLAALLGCWSLALQ